MRPGHNETKAKTETRECKTETETETEKLLYETETKNYETETSSVKSSQLHVKVTQIGMFHFLLHTWGEWWTGNGFCIWGDTVNKMFNDNN